MIFEELKNKVRELQCREIEEEDFHQHSNGGGWVENTAKVKDAARVLGDAMVLNGAEITGFAIVSGDAKVYGNAIVSENAKVSGNAMIIT